jgi:hypothetical protein
MFSVEPFNCVHFLNLFQPHCFLFHLLSVLINASPIVALVQAFLDELHHFIAVLDSQVVFTYLGIDHRHVLVHVNQ